MPIIDHPEYSSVRPGDGRDGSIAVLAPQPRRALSKPVVLSGAECHVGPAASSARLRQFELSRELLGIFAECDGLTAPTHDDDAGGGFTHETNVDAMAAPPRRCRNPVVANSLFRTGQQFAQKASSSVEKGSDCPSVENSLTKSQCRSSFSASVNGTHPSLGASPYSF